MNPLPAPAGGEGVEDVGPAVLVQAAGHPGRGGQGQERRHQAGPDLRGEKVDGGGEEAHEEACRWEHVMSDSVEKRVYELLNKPTRSPYGNPIPGLEQLGAPDDTTGSLLLGERNLAFPGLSGSVVIQRICESVQTNADVLRQLHAAGINPGTTVTVAQERDGVTIDGSAGDKIRLPREVASRVFVAAR